MAVFTPSVLTLEHAKLDNSEIGLNLIPHNTDKRRKSPALRKRAARPKSLVLSSEENPPRKRVRPTTTSTPLNLNLQGTSEPSTSIEIKDFSVPPFLLVRPVPLSVARQIESRNVQCVEVISLNCDCLCV